MQKNILVWLSLLLLAVLSRLVPHSWNFTLVGGTFIFAGAYFKDYKVSAALMLTAMLISDAVIGFHGQMLSVYLGYLVMVLVGTMLGAGAKRGTVLGGGAAAALSFFFITNFAVWFEGKLYPTTLQGLIDCYLMAIPFFRNQLLSDVLTAFALFELARLVPASVSAKSN